MGEDARGEWPMTKEEFLDAVDWAIGAVMDPAGYVRAEDLRSCLLERIRWIEVINSPIGDAVYVEEAKDESISRDA